MRWLVLLLVFALSGCAQAPDDLVVDDVPLPVDLPVEELNVTGEAPSWDVGDWHGHHVFLGNGDNEGFHINSIVTEANGGYFLATDDADFAKLEGAYDVPQLGAVSADLSTQAFGGEWDLYAFPITDGKTWVGRTHLDVFGEQAYDIEFEATFNPAIKTVTGTYPGYDILGTVAGVPLIETNYVPAIGWYSVLVYYDITTEEPEDYFFRVISMGFGDGWTGTYYVGVADEAVAAQANMHPSGDGFTVDANPYNTFLMRDEHTDLFGFAYAYAYAGAATLELIAPDNTRYTVQVTETSGQDAAVAQEFVDIPAQAGEWRVAMANAGVAAGAGAFLWSVTVSEDVL